MFRPYYMDESCGRVRNMDAIRTFILLYGCHHVNPDCNMDYVCFVRIATTYMDESCGRVGNMDTIRTFILLYG